MYKQVKPGFTNYQPQPKYSWALSKIEAKREKIQQNQKLQYYEKIENC